MRLISRNRQKSARLDHEVNEIRARVQTMRDLWSRREVTLADVFAMVGENDRPPVSANRQPIQPQMARVWPEQVATADPDLEPKVTYGDWELMRRPGPFTVP
jgi:hypothetical protein